MTHKFSKIFNLSSLLKQKINKLDKFVKDYTEVSQTSEIPAMAYMNWGIQLAGKGKIDEAVDKLRTATLMANQHPSAYINLGIAQIKQKNFEEAIKNFRKAVKIDKFNSKAYAMWASALSEIGDLKGAIDIYKLAQKFDSRDPDIYLNWGISLARANRKLEAEEKFKKAVSLNPINPLIPFLWGIILLEQERYDEAINKFNHSLTYTDDRYDALYYLSYCYLKLNNYKLAQQYAQEAKSLDSSRVEPYIILAECFINTAQDEACLKTFEEAEQNAQPNTQFYANWGIALQKYNHIDEAREKWNLTEK